MTKILIAAPIHEDEKIFKLYLKHLRNLNIPKDVEVFKLFMLHNCENFSHLLEENEQGIIYNNITNYSKDETTHNWKADNFKDVTIMKNKLKDIALNENFDYIFYVDSDLMLHKNTLVDLLDADKDMISETFWTKWNNNGVEKDMPNCWHFDNYTFISKLFSKLIELKDYHRVGMTGACTLIKRKVLENPVINWNPINNISFTQWEDRAFCTRVSVAGFEIWTSNNYPAKHLYRTSEYDKFIEGGGINE